MSRKETESSRAPSAKPNDLAQAVNALTCGGVIIFPTETLYGLGADALNGCAVEKVFELKGRDSEKPIPVLVADQQMLLTLVSKIPPKALILMKALWPGPLTLVLPAREDAPKPLVNAAGGVGVRISGHEIATRLVRMLGRPITATSANPSGKDAARTLAEAREYFQDRVDVFLDGGTLTSKTGSTVVEVNADSMKIIREGEIRASEIERILGEEELES